MTAGPTKTANVAVLNEKIVGIPSVSVRGDLVGRPIIKVLRV